jgi:putative SOS response-associated peptidase YedK
MCNRVRASFEWREIKVRFSLFNDLPDFKPSHNVTPDRGGILSIVRTPQGNEGRLMYWPLVPSFATSQQLEYSTMVASTKKSKFAGLALGVRRFRNPSLAQTQKSPGLN